MTKTYDPKDVSITVNGVVCKGFADSEFITIERDLKITHKKFKEQYECTFNDVDVPKEIKPRCKAEL